jgi:hypothetical protein
MLKKQQRSHPRVILPRAGPLPIAFQLANTWLVPPAPRGEVVAMVWLDPGVQLSVCGAVSAMPSTPMLNPAGSP